MPPLQSRVNLAEVNEARVKDAGGTSSQAALPLYFPTPASVSFANLSKS